MAALALFDLDHTLIPFDSGALFARFLVERGALDDSFEPQYLAYCRRYAEGSVDMVEMHRFTVGTLGRHPPRSVALWLHEFESTLAAQVPEAARELVREHAAAGHLCALVTATTRFIAEPFARSLGLAEVVATEPAVDRLGRYTGEIIGEPCFREHKVGHVSAWLARRGLAWTGFERTWFYSDSLNDLALLEAVSDPVVVSPDPRLRAIAAERGWPERRLAPAASYEPGSGA
jgi:HAD superfamily hydrolase (TIGR01490 family)